MVAALERRRDHLAERVQGWDPRRGDPSRTRHELVSIQWALRIIRSADAEGVLRDFADLTRPVDS